MAKNKGCVNCKYFKTHKMDSAECYECTNKSAWKTTADAVFGKIIVTLCNELNKKLDCTHYKKDPKNNDKYIVKGGKVNNKISTSKTIVKK